MPETSTRKLATHRSQGTESSQVSVSMAEHSKKSNFIRDYTGFTSRWVFLACLFTTGLFSLFSAALFLAVKRDGRFDAPFPSGERFWYNEIGRGRWMMQIHLWCVAPAGSLLPLQFIPLIRRRLPKVHRWTGYIISTLLFVGSVAGLIQGKHVYGGTWHSRLYVLFLALGGIGGTIMAVTTARNSEFGKHRVWAFRTWGVTTSVMTMRLVVIPLAIFYEIMQYPGSYGTLTCAEITYLRSTNTAMTSSSLASPIDLAIDQLYPSCAPTLDSLQLPHDTIRWVQPGYQYGSDVEKRPSYLQAARRNTTDIIYWKDILERRMGDESVRLEARMRYPEEQYAFIRLIFGWCGLACLLFHIPGVEVWLWWTRDETERLRKMGDLRRRAGARQKKVE